MQDISYAVRMLRTHKGFSSVVILILALGIGATTAIFSVVNAVLLRPLPYAQAERTVLVWGNFLKLNIHQLQAKAAEYVDYRDRTQSFAQVAAFETADMNLTGSGEAERFTVAGLRAEREANAEFLCPLRDAEGHDAVKTYRREQEGDARKDAEHQAVETRFGETLGEEFVE